MKALAVIGYHHTGKTTLVCTLIKQLTALGYSVASVKDIHAEGFRVDVPGKNTAKHAEAGSKMVFAKGLQDSGLLFPRSISLKEMLPYLSADFLIIEGMKEAPVPKLVCAETTPQWDELIDETTIGLSGMLADSHKSYKGLPVFCLQHNLQELTDLVISKSFEILPLSDPECCSACGKTCFQMAKDIVQGHARRSDCVLDGSKELILSVGGKETVIVPFVQKIMREVILALVDNLKDIDPKGEINIKIKR